MVNGKCQCKSGFYQEGGKCVDCSEEYDNLDNISKYRYWLGIKSGGHLDYEYTWLDSFVGPQSTQSSGGEGFQVDHDIPVEDMPTAACPDRSKALQCCSYTKQLEERINKFREHCPTMKVDMPHIECGYICTNSGAYKSNCYSEICNY